jgi:hypothetical protein
MVTVKVIWQSSGKPAESKRVSLGIDHTFTSGSSGDQFTDSNGEAHFDVKPGRGKVYVNGKTEYEGSLSGRVVVYI